MYESIQDKFHGRISQHAQTQLIKSVEHSMGAKSIVRRSFNVGDNICTENQLRDSFYIIVQGQVCVSQDQVPLETLSRGDYFPLGVSGTVFDDERKIRRRTATVTCLTPTQVLEIRGELFRNFLSHNHFLSTYLQNQIQTRASKREEKRRSYLYMTLSLYSLLCIIVVGTT